MPHSILGTVNKPFMDDAVAPYDLGVASTRIEVTCPHFRMVSYRCGYGRCFATNHNESNSLSAVFGPIPSISCNSSPVTDHSNGTPSKWS